MALYPAALTAAVTPVPELGVITITNPSGSHRATIALQQVLSGGSGALVAVGWAQRELLVCVTTAGAAQVFSAHGALGLPVSQSLTDHAYQANPRTIVHSQAKLCT